MTPKWLNTVVLSFKNPSRTQRLLGVCGLAVGASLLGSGWSTGDDTYIYMNYARSLFNGFGYAYNTTPSAGATSLAWLVLAGGLSKVSGLGVLGWKLLGVVLFTASILLILKTRWLSLPLFLVVLLNPLTLRWSSSGMENSLTMLFVSLLVYCVLSDNPSDRYKIFLLAPLSLLFRPELSLLASIFCVLCLLEGIPKLKVAFLYGLLGLVVLAVPIFGFDLELIPQTAAAKGIFLKMPDRLYSVETLAKICFVSGGSVALVALMRLRSFGRSGLYLAGCAFYVLVVCGYLVHKNSLISTRYETGVFFPLLLLACLCLQLQYRKLGRWIRRLFYTQFAVSLSLFVFFTPVKLVDEGRAIGDFADKSRDVILNQGNGLTAVALSEVGAFGYYSQLPIVDTLGLVSGHALEFYRETGSKPTANIDSLEGFLRRYSLLFYVETSGGETPIVGKSLRFTPLLETLITRNNMSKMRPNMDRWRLYRVEGH